MPKIIPTIGRRVWFWEQATQSHPFDAGIAYVHSDNMINISHADHNGVMWSKTSVPLWDGEGARPQAFYCEWMPYQKDQAAKVTDKPLAEVIDPDGPAPGTDPNAGVPVAEGEAL